MVSTEAWPLVHVAQRLPPDVVKYCRAAWAVGVAVSDGPVVGCPGPVVSVGGLDSWPSRRLTSCWLSGSPEPALARSALTVVMPNVFAHRTYFNRNRLHSTLERQTPYEARVCYRPPNALVA
jgi:hypothetical protein